MKYWSPCKDFQTALFLAPGDLVAATACYSQNLLANQVKTWLVDSPAGAGTNELLCKGSVNSQPGGTNLWTSLLQLPCIWKGSYSLTSFSHNVSLNSSSMTSLLGERNRGRFRHAECFNCSDSSSKIWNLTICTFNPVLVLKVCSHW